ncbi:hypothetical protein O6A27_06205 [Escherichia coli]|nr:hypothetical protein [Escherichia coli]
MKRWSENALRVLAQTDGWQMLQAPSLLSGVLREDGWAGLRDLNGNIHAGKTGFPA